MARQPRIALAGRPHVLIQSAAGDTLGFVDDEDRRAYLAAMHESARAAGVVLHAYAMASRRVQMLATPDTGEALARFMQRVGRRYVLAFNRRHRFEGRLWASRFASATLLSEQYLLRALLATEQLPVQDGCVTNPEDWTWSSAGHHLGHRPDSRLSDPSCYWALGNTPFERQARYAGLLSSPLPQPERNELETAARGGWPLGLASDIQQAQRTWPERPLKPAPRGRPTKTD